LIVAFIWFILSLKRWHQLLKLQYCIAGVIALGMIESATLYFENLGYNISGQNYVGAMIVGVLIITIKKAVSRILVLVVAMGYGIVRPTLGTSKNKVLLYGILYLIFSGILNVIELVQRTTVISLSLVFFIVFPVALLDTGFYWWIFLSLIRTISQLQIRKQTIKLVMYKRFFFTLIISGIISALIIVIQLLLTVSDDLDKQWRIQFLWTAFWHLLYLAILLAIAVLWRPTDNNTRYAYSEMGPEPEEFTLQSLNVIGDAIQRKTRDDIQLGDLKSSQDNMQASFTITDDEDQPSKME